MVIIKNQNGREVIACLHYTIIKLIKQIQTKYCKRERFHTDYYVILVFKLVTSRTCRIGPHSTTSLSDVITT